MVENSEVVYDRKDQQVITRLHDLTDKRQKSVILTFDDGPGRYLTQILDVLKTENTPAMFFWQTRLLYTARPWRRVIEEGHLIGSHSCRHPVLSKMEYQEQYKELLYSKQKLEKITGQPVRYFRPPFGQYDTSTLKAGKALGMIPVIWSTASLDWELIENPDQIVSNVTDHLEDGAIILLHELPQTVSILPELIRQIRQIGYSFTTLPAS